MNRLKIFILFLGIVVSFFVVTPVSAQSFPQNFSNFNVTDYSDEQLSVMLQKAQAQGLSDAEFLQAAQSKGLSADQTKKLQQRIGNLRKKAGSNLADTADFSGRKAKSNNSDQTDAANAFLSNKPFVFGSNLFRNAKANTFQPNLKLATPVNYVVGPDDILQVNVYGNSIANWNLTVSPEGNINIPGVGVLNIAGKTIEQATVAIKARLAANNYAIGRGTTVQVSLGDIRTIKVIIQGEVVKPGTYDLSSLSTAFDALYAAGGPNDIGSFRKIEIIRDSKVVSKLDLYDFITSGNRKGNIVLRDQDVILVPPYDIHVELQGEVKVPAIFETLPADKLQDVLSYAGGFTNEAYTARITVDQVNNQQRRFKDITDSQFKSYTPQRGDRFIVGKILSRYENRVTISGAVFRPGDYELQPGLTLSQLLKNAGGLQEDAFTGRGSIERLNADNSKQLVAFNLQDVLTKPSSDVVLQREDKVIITSIFDLRNKYTIEIKGEIRNPGRFDYADSMKVADLIIKAGGFSEGASPKRIEVSRRIFDSNPNVKDTKVAEIFSVNVSPDLKFEEGNLTLKPFDIISVYSLPGYEKQKTVKVEGEVIFPGNYTIEKKNEKISDIIRRAGGLTQSADVEGGNLRRNSIAVAEVEKNKLDTANLTKERYERLKRLQRNYNPADTSMVDTMQLRNNYVGINLKKILARPGIGDDLILENGDVLRVPKQQQTVSINGEVLYPSSVVYSKGKTLGGYVLNAGGFSPNALKRGAYVVYPNGTVKATTKFLFFNNHPRVKPGSEIFVPRKPVRRNDVAQQILGYTTGLASLGAIILGLITLKK